MNGRRFFACLVPAVVALAVIGRACFLNAQDAPYPGLAGPMTLSFSREAVALYPRACFEGHCVSMEELLTFIAHEGL